MKSYFSTLIDKSTPFETTKLQKKLENKLKKSFKIPRSTINSKEHNTFLFLGFDKTIKIWKL